MHDHSHETVKSQKKLVAAFVITLAFMVTEVVGGLVFNSLALLADAGHMLSDLTALGVSLFALRLARRPADARHTFGFKRAEILAALFNGLLLWAIVAVIFYESVQRLFDPADVKGPGMLIVACAGLLVNLIMAGLLFGERTKSLNIRGAFLHVVSDALGSVGAIAAALVIIFTGFRWADPLAGIFIGVVILFTSWGLVRDAVSILMEAAPPDVSVTDVEDAIVDLDGVCCVYDLHLWSIAGQHNSLSCHVVLTEPNLDRDKIRHDINKMLKERFSMEHTTIQVEPGHEFRPQYDLGRCREGTVCEWYDPAVLRDRAS